MEESEPAESSQPFSFYLYERYFFVREQPFDIRLPGRFLKPLIVEELFRGGDVLLVQFDPDGMKDGSRSEVRGFRNFEP